MKPKDITLSASLIAIYVAINVAGAASPISVSALAGSAVFGMFWPYFSLKRNLTFQGFRVGWVLISMIRSAPRIVSYMNMQSTAGLAIFDWVYGEFKTPIDLKPVELMTTLAQLKLGPQTFIFLGSFLILFYSVVPYFFYRYFKAIGLFKRLPSF